MPAALSIQEREEIVAMREQADSTTSPRFQGEEKLETHESQISRLKHPE